MRWACESSENSNKSKSVNYDLIYVITWNQISTYLDVVLVFLFLTWSILHTTF